MIRLLTTSALLVAVSVETVMPPQDFVTYAITQGGLLAVALLMIWVWRKDTLGSLQMERDRAQALMTLVANNTEAMTKSSDAIHSQARSIEGLARAVEKIEERRQSR